MAEAGKLDQMRPPPQCVAAEPSSHPSLLPIAPSIPFCDASWSEKKQHHVTLPQVFILLLSLQQMHKGAERQAGGPLGNRISSSPGLQASCVLKSSVFQGSNIS